MCRIAGTFNGKTYAIGDNVFYSVYPHVTHGTGIVTYDGVQSTGATLEAMTAAGMGDICPWESLYDVHQCCHQMVCIECLTIDLENRNVWTGDTFEIVNADGCQRTRHDDDAETLYRRMQED